MHMRVIVAGKPALGFIRDGVEEYLKRLTRFGGCEWMVVKAGTRDEVSARLLEKSAGCFRVALDERGETPTTRRLAERIAALEQRGEVKTLAFLIGAADGHTDALRAECDWLLSLSALTLQHEMAALLLLEQLYRVASLRAGSPYHRD
jgi:23S rRNA (pseudouridine1915-N3)-methyltransferase